MSHFDDPQTRDANLAFIRRSMNTPLLSKEEEQRLTRAWRDDSDEQSLHALVEAYSRLVVATAARFRHYGLPSGDLIQEGVLGLMQAANRFEPERDLRFATYASWWVRSAMQDFVLRNWSIVRTGTTAAQKSLFFNMRRLRRQIEENDGEVFGQAGREMIAAQLGVRLTDVEDMEGRLFGGDSSLDANLGDDSETAWIDMLADDRPTPEDQVQDMYDQDRRSTWIGQALDCLNERERIIITERRLQEEGVTLESLGERFGVSKERVRQLENRAMRKMRTWITAQASQPEDLRF
jgi:RNA polymerase sigma-32 factor